MEWLSEIWVWVASALGGVSLAGIISAIIYGCLKGAFSKTISKINVEKISEEATEKGIDKIKNLSFTQSIQPVVESELKKITEQANEYIKKTLEDTQARYDKLVNVIEKLSAYFDNSVYVDEKTKAELKEALAEAKSEPVVEQTITVEETVEETKEEPVKTEETVTTAVER